MRQTDRLCPGVTRLCCVSFGRNMTIILPSSSSSDNHNNKSLTNKFWEWHSSTHTRNYHQTSWWLLFNSQLPAILNTKTGTWTEILWRSLKMQVFRCDSISTPTHVRPSVRPLRIYQKVHQFDNMTSMTSTTTPWHPDTMTPWHHEKF